MTPSKPSRARRLLVVTHYYPAHGGGVEGVAHNIARHLLELDCELEIVWCAGDCDPLPPARERLSLLPLRVWNGLEKRLGIPFPFPFPVALWRLWQEVRRCDAVHLHDFPYPSNAFTALFCQLQRKPYFLTQHIGMVPYKNPLLRFVLSLLNGTLGRWSLKRAARVAFCSQRVEAYFGRFLPRSRRAFVPNGVDANQFFPAQPDERAALRAQLGVEADELAVAFVSRFVEKKGVPFLLALAARFPDVKWLLAGRGPLDPGDECAPNVHVWRDKSGREIGDLLRAADLLVLPSLGEGFPLVVQEALACGTPVLAECDLGRAEPGAKPWLHLEPLGRADDEERWNARLSAVLEEVADTPRETERRKERAAWAQHRWNWTRCAAFYLGVFDQITTKDAR